MGAYKDGNSGKWQAVFADYGPDGKRRVIHKRGFATKREAKEYEESWKRTNSGSPDMTFREFVYGHYYPDVEPRLKKLTFIQKKRNIESYVLPFFGNLKLNEIEPKTIVKFQNEILNAKNKVTGEAIAQSYKHKINLQLTAILRHAERYYGLKNNPIKSTETIPEGKIPEPKIWTFDEYQKFAAVIKKKSPMYYLAFEIAYYCMLRLGELQGLVFGDVDYEQKTLTISRTYIKLNNQEIITTPKTDNTRVLHLPDFLLEEIRRYHKYNYGAQLTDRMFTMSRTALRSNLTSGAKEAGVPEIRFHALRHSGLSWAYQAGFTPLQICERSGHAKGSKVLWNYLHNLASGDKEIAEKLESLVTASKNTDEQADD